MIELTGVTVTGVKVDLVKEEMRLTFDMTVKEDMLDLGQKLRLLAVNEVALLLTLAPVQPPLPGMDADPNPPGTWRAPSMELVPANGGGDE